MGEIKRHEVAGVGIAVGDYESDFLRLEDGYPVGICDLVRRADGEVLDESDIGGFTYTDDPDFKTEWERYRADYRTRTGRPHPRVYRARVAIELEELPDAEAAAWWAARAKGGE